MRTILVALTGIIATPILGSICVIATLLGARRGAGSVFEWCGRSWNRAMCVAGGVTIRVHNPELMAHEGARIYVANHTSWFDIFALATVLPYYTFIAKAELSRLPVFGWAGRAFGLIFIERANRKAAFDSYKNAGKVVRDGQSVIVYPEGTRGYTYELRPFKKGPFVFAISAGVPIVPTIVYGALEVHAKGSLRVRPGVVHIHLLEPVETSAFSYEERDQLMRIVWKRMAMELQEIYGVESHSGAIVSEGQQPRMPTSFL